MSTSMKQVTSNTIWHPFLLPRG